MKWSIVPACWRRVCRNPYSPLLQEGSSKNLQRLVEKFGNREHFSGMAVYDAKENVLAVTEKLAINSSSVPSLVASALNRGVEVSTFETVGDKRMHVYVLPLRAKDGVVGALVVFQDATYIQSQLAPIWRIAFFRVLTQVFLITLVTLLVVRWSIVAPSPKWRSG